MSRPERNQMIWQILLLAGILLVFLAEFAYMSNAPQLVDERTNWKQISIFLREEINIQGGLNVFPAYHALIAAVMLIFHTTGISSARFITIWISFASVIVFYLVAWKVCSRPSLVKTLQYAFFPLFFPFFSLVYTDILAMLLVLLAFYLVLWKKYTLSGIVGFMSLLTRTNNIAWFAFLYVFIYVENYGWNLREFPKSLKMTWSYLAGFAVFAVFLVLNGGVALTAKAVQPLGGLYSGNIAYLLFLWTFLFLPLNLANIPKIIRLVTTRWRWILPTGFIAYLVYMLTFHSTNPFNLGRLNYYPRNRLLMAVTHSLALKSAFFIPVAWSALSISVTRLRQKNYYLLYPFIVLSLIPIWLIEPRYSFVPLAFFLLFKEEQSSLVEGLTIALYIVVCIALLPPIRSQLFFL